MRASADVVMTSSRADHLSRKYRRVTHVGSTKAVDGCGEGSSPGGIKISPLTPSVNRVLVIRVINPTGTQSLLIQYLYWRCISLTGRINGRVDVSNDSFIIDAAHSLRCLISE